MPGANEMMVGIERLPDRWEGLEGTRFLFLMYGAR